jgi:hypothetical protein
MSDTGRRRRGRPAAHQLSNSPQNSARVTPHVTLRVTPATHTGHMSVHLLLVVTG